MKMATGRFVSGRVVVDGSELLQEGVRAGVRSPSDGGGFDLSADDEAELVRALEAAETEGFVPADELLRRLGGPSVRP